LLGDEGELVARKSDEEKQLERDAKERKAIEEREAYEERARAIGERQAAAAFAASPVGRASAAFDRNDTFFQLETEVSALDGGASLFGSSTNVITHSGAATDLLGQIEAIGWHLEHAGYVFIETGATSTNRILTTGQGTVTQGNVTGIYLFRRASRA
jgi:hypothetical protein